MLENVTIHKVNYQQQIPIIRAIRDKTGCGLKMAKECYDEACGKPVTLYGCFRGLAADLRLLGCETSSEPCPEVVDLFWAAIDALTEYRKHVVLKGGTAAQREPQYAAEKALDQALAALPPRENQG